MSKGKTIKHTVRMSEAESRKLEKWAKKSGLSKAEFIRQKVFGKEPHEMPEPVFWAHLEELYKLHGKIKDSEPRKDLEQFIMAVQREATQGEVRIRGNHKPLEHERSLERPDGICEKSCKDAKSGIAGFF